MEDRERLEPNVDRFLAAGGLHLPFNVDILIHIQSCTGDGFDTMPGAILAASVVVTSINIYTMGGKGFARQVNKQCKDIKETRHRRSVRKQLMQAGNIAQLKWNREETAEEAPEPTSSNTVLNHLCIKL